MNIKEDGKTFEYCGGNTFERIHDEKYNGKRTVYFRCEECGRLVNKRWIVYHNSVHKSQKYL